MLSAHQRSPSLPLPTFPTTNPTPFIHPQQVLAMQRLGEFLVLNTTCPRASQAKGGGFVVPARPQKLECLFQVTGQPPMGGTISALVYPDSTPTSPPLPADPSLYRLTAAQRVPLGECAVLGASRTLKKQGSEYAVEGQPSGPPQEGLPAGPVCGSFATTYTLTFGPFERGQCGRYAFAGDMSARPSNATRAVRASLSFGVDVTGCRNRRHLSRHR